MDRLTSRMGLPVLTKELIEQSSRRRTWYIRVSFLGLLMLTFLGTAYTMFQGGNVQSMLGGGGMLFSTLVNFQWWGVFVLVPLSCFGLITAEKERDSLQLLFLTRLGPWTILLEKLLSRLVPMSLFLLASLPLLAVSYSYGGVSPEMLTNAIVCLGSTAFFLASIALMLSTYAHVSTQAFFGTVAFTVVTILIPVVALVVIVEMFGHGFITSFLTFLSDDDMLAGMFFGPVIFYADQNKSLATCLIWNTPQLVFGAGCLLMSRVFLTRRAFSQKSSAGRRARQLVDRAANTILNKPRNDDMPAMTKPITWIERRQGMSGRPAYLVFLLAIIGGLLTLGAVIGAFSEWLEIYSLFCLSILWMVAPVVICGKGAGLFGTERSRQTLDVLLTTPITSRTIVQQKIGGVWPLMVFLLTLFLLLCIFNVVGVQMYPHDEIQPLPLTVLANMLTAVVYLTLFAWMSVLIGLRAKTSARATIYSVVVLAGWCIGPWMFVTPCLMFSVGPAGPDSNWEQMIAYVFPIITPAFFPAMCIAAFATDDVLQQWFGESLMVNCVFYGSIALSLRWYCLKYAAKALDRPDRS